MMAKISSIWDRSVFCQFIRRYGGYGSQMTCYVTRCLDVRTDQLLVFDESFVLVSCVICVISALNERYGGRHSEMGITSGQFGRSDR